MWRWNRSWLWLIIACLALIGPQLLSAPQPCMAQTAAEDTLNAEIGKIDDEASKDVNKADEALKEQFGTAKEEIQSFLNEKLSYGNIAALLATSANSGKPKQDVLGLVKSGKKWGEIAGQLGADLEVILTQVQEVGKKVSAEAAAKPKRKMKFAPGT